MRVLVTGGCGFVGRHFVKRLLDDGHDVTSVDNMSSGVYPQEWAFKPVSIDKFKCLFVDAETYFRSLELSYYDLIVHCAAVVGGRLKIEGDPLAVATDLAIDATLFDRVVRDKYHQVATRKPTVIYFSSSAVYPIDLQLPNTNCSLSEALCTLTGRRIGMPDMTYGWAKLSGEYLAGFAAKHYGLDVKIYRPFGGYGEDQSFDYPFPSIIRRVVQGEDPVVVWGSGDQKRDFIHIDDIVNAVLATYNVLPTGTVLNLGSGEGTSFRQLALLAGEVLGKKVRVQANTDKPEGVFARVADTLELDQHYRLRVSLRNGIMRVAHAIQATTAQNGGAIQAAAS